MKRLLQINPFISLFSLVVLFMITTSTLAIDSKKNVSEKILAVPTFTSVPAAGATGVNQSVDIVLTFNEAIRGIPSNQVLDDTNIDGRITLKVGSSVGADIPFDATINAGKTIVTINPTGNLPSLTVIYVAIGDVEAISDDADINPNPTSFTFVVGDFAPPMATFSPPGGALNVPISSNLIISFDETIRKTDGSPLDAAAIEAGIVELKVTNDAGVIVPFTATFNGTNQITIDPTTNLLNNTTYYLELNPIEDAAGNETVQTTITFSTPDTITPTLTFSPIDGATNVLETTTIVINFTESVRALDDSQLTPAILATLLKLRVTDNAGANVPFTAGINGPKTQIVITPTSVLAGNTQYYVEITQVEDFSNNATTTSSITFTTGDSLPPAISFNPSGGSINFSTVGNIVITFNEPIRNINNSPITTTNIEGGLVEFKETNNGGTTVSFTATINGTNTVVTLNPNATLKRNQVYYIEVNPVEDGVNNATTAQNITFTTEDRPSISSFAPSAGTCIGDNVTINGARFTGTGNPVTGNTMPIVSVNGVAIPAANISSFNATQIVFTLPAGSTTGPITVRNTDSDLVSANSATDLNVFAAIDTSLPVTPATLNPAQNTSVAVQITGTQSSSYNYTMILNSGPGGYTATTQNASGNNGNRTLTTTPSLSVIGSYTYRIDVSRTNCTTKTLTNTPFTLTVASLAVSVTTTTPLNQVCSGSPVTLIGAASGGTGFYQFRWTSTPAGYTSSSSSPTVTPTSNIRYNLEVEDNVGNIVTDFVDIVVNPVPTATFQPVPGESSVRVNYTIANIDYQLYGSQSGPNAVFSGPGVKKKNDGFYYFNPFDASTGTKQIVFTYTAPNGCSASETKNFIVTNSVVDNLQQSYCKAVNIQTGLTPNAANSAVTFSAPHDSGYQFTRLTYYNNGKFYGGPDDSGIPGINALTVTSSASYPDIANPLVNRTIPTSYSLNINAIRNTYGFSGSPDLTGNSPGGNYYYILVYGKNLLNQEYLISFQYFEIVDNGPAPSIVGITEFQNICSDGSNITLSSSETTYAISSFTIIEPGFPTDHNNSLTGSTKEIFSPGYSSFNGLDERKLRLTMNYSDKNNCPASVTRNFNWVKKPIAPITNNFEYCQVPNATSFKISGEPNGASDKPFWYDAAAQTAIIDSTNWNIAAPGINGTSPIIKNFLVLQQYKGCKGSTSQVRIEIKPAPDAGFVTPSICQGKPFNITGSIDTDLSQPYDKYEWNFGDGKNVEVLNNQNISYAYSADGGFPINLRVTNTRGCQNAALRNITVGLNPKPTFTQSIVCEGDQTQFVATTDITVSKFEWNFGDGNSIPQGFVGDNVPSPDGGTFREPKHTLYDINSPTNASGDYTVTVTSYTNLGCFSSFSKTVTILDTLKRTNSNPYSMASLEEGKGLWRLEDISASGNSTWEFAQPTTNLMNVFKTPAWVTNANGEYTSNERSYLNSPCFNIEDIDRPVLSLDLVINTDKNKDGAVLEYSKDGGINWVQTGGINSGINWFNTSGFGLGNIGSSPFGWSGNPWDLEDNPDGANKDTLVQARKALDNINNLSKADRAKIRFRIAFASDGNTEFEGVGFNNLTIDSRDRISLVENFTNQADAGYAANNNAFKNISGAETAKIQYHVGYPGNDVNYLANKADPSARAAYYGIALTDQIIPRGYIDGVSNGRFDQTNWVDNRFNKQGLKNSPYTLAVDTQVPADPSFLKIAVSLKADANIPANRKPILQIAVVEKTVAANEFVLRKLVPSAAGTPLPVPMAKDATLAIVENIRIENAADVTNLALVVFIQDEVTREVYQSAFNLTPTNLPTASVITGIEHIAEFIQLYPNPANDSFVIELPTKTDSRLSIHLVDQVGRLVLESSMETGEQTKTINTQDLAGGIYIVQIGTGNSGVVRKKIMIVHKN